MRLPEVKDFDDWSKLRLESRAFLEPWEPLWKNDHLTKEAFHSRVEWAETAANKMTALPLLMINRKNDVVIGGITLDNIRFGPSQTGNLGYWIGERYSRQGYMKEAIFKLIHYAFVEMDLSRLEAACIPENTASRNLLEKTGFKYEGVAQSYLEVAGKWRTHVLYANLRQERRNHAKTNQ